jgi:hypothetical protein
MARRRVRGRAGSGRQDATASRTTGRRKVARGNQDASVVSSVFGDVVTTVETGAVGAFRFGQEVVGSGVSRAVSIGSDTLNLIGGAARGVLSVGARMAESIIGTAQGVYQDALATATQSPARARRPRQAGRTT